MFSNTSNSSDIVVKKPLPYLHPKIDLNDWYSNGMLLLPEEVEQVNAIFARDPTLKRHKFTTRNGKRYNIHRVINGAKTELVLMYLGAKHFRALGIGGYAKTKITQRLSDKSIGAVKVNQELKVQELQFFEREIEVLRKYNRFLGIYVNQLQTRHAVYMPLIRGISLKEFLQLYGDISVHDRLVIADNLCQIMSELHALGIIHCDFKPENIIIDPVSLRLTLLDFQSAQKAPASQTSFPLTTAPYADPNIKQVKKDAVHYHYSFSSDVYSLAIIIGEVFQLINYATNKHEPHGLKSKTGIRLNYNKMSLILDTLNNMTSLHFHRPELPVISKLFANLLAAADINYRREIGIVDISEFLAYQSLWDNADLADAIRAKDEIWFIDAKGEHEPEYLRVRRLFESDYAKASDVLLVGKQAQVSLPALLKAIPALEPEAKFNYTFLTAKPVPQEIIHSLQTNAMTTHICPPRPPRPPRPYSRYIISL